MNKKHDYRELEQEIKILKERINSFNLTDKFESFFKNNKAAMLQIDLETKQIIDVNKAATDFYGYTKNELIKIKINDLNILPLKEIEKKIQIAAQKTSNILELKHKLSDGSIKDVEVFTSPFKAGNKMYIYVLIHDISKRKKIERKILKQNKEFAALNEEYKTINEELKEKNKEFAALYEEYKSQNEELKDALEQAEKNEQKFKETTNLLPQIVYECDLEGNINYVNHQAFKLFGYSEKDFEKGINIMQTIIPEDVKRAKENIRKFLYEEDPKDYEYTALRKDGTTFPILIYSNPITINNKPVGLRGVIIDISETKHAEEEIKIQNKKLKLITEIEKIGTFDWDLQTNCAVWNDEMFIIHGIPKQITIPYDTWKKCIHPEDRDETVSILAESIQTKSPRFAEFRIVRPDGKIRFVRASASVITDKKGNVTNSVGLTKDITEQKETQDQIKDQLKQIELINANIQNVIWKTNIDKKGNFINSYVSDVIDDFLALPKGTINNNWNEFFKFVKPEYTELLFNSIKKVFENPGSKITVDYEVIKANGEIAWFSSKGHAVLENDILTGYGTTIDITERKKAEKDLLKAKEKAEENETKFKGIFNYSPQPISISNLSGNLIEVNNKVCELSGYSKEELLGRNILEIGLYKNKKDREKFVKELEKNGKVEDLEMEFTNRNQVVLKTLFSANIIKIKGEQYILSMITDITKRKQAEEETIKAKEKAEESDRLKTEFINNMSHEIRTPMNGILGFSELLSSPDLTEEKQKNYINIIRNSGLQLMRIIDDILEISKLGTKQIKAINKKINLNDLLLELFSIFDIKAKENKIALYLKKGLSDNNSYVFTDSSKLSKILSNLLENAIKFTNTGSIEFGYNIKNNKIVFFVKDTGIGIKKEKQKIIFERFSQEEKRISEQAGGLGLGLSIAKENAELLGGNITLESEKGVGSTFYITIPYNPANNDKIDILTEKKHPSKKNKTILIVEDEEVNYIYIETLLEYFNKDIIKLHAKNGKEAVELCRRRKDIDFILMDLKMPIMNGYEATKEIKKFRPDIPIIAQTAYSTTEEKAKALSAGCDDFISKPINKEIFSKIINKYKSL